MGALFCKESKLCGREKITIDKIGIYLVEQQCFPLNFFKEDLEFLKEQNLICSICNGVVKDAVFDSCGHSFGYDCIQKKIKIEQKCPINQKTFINLFNANIARIKVDQLELNQKNIDEYRGQTRQVKRMKKYIKNKKFMQSD